MTRKFLAGMGLTEAQMDSVVEEHTATVNRLTEELKAHEGDARRIAELEKELQDAKGGEDWKGRHDALKAEFDRYKTEVAGKESAAKVRAAYRELLKAENVDDKRLDVVLRATNFDGMKLDGDGLKDAEKLREGIRKDWSDFIVTTQKKGAEVENPPGNGGGGKKTRAEILAIEDTAERQKAIAENHEMFGF